MTRKDTSVLNRFSFLYPKNAETAFNELSDLCIRDIVFCGNEKEYEVLLPIHNLDEENKELEEKLKKTIVKTVVDGKCAIEKVPAGLLIHVS